MKLSVEISLDQPCSENWDTMTPVERGRFCEACQKTVIDMTNWMERDFVDFFNANPSGTCGRFLGHQLNRKFTDTPQRQRRTPAYRKAAAMIMSFFAVQSALAQQPDANPVAHATPASPQPEDVRISGTVTDPDSVPLRDVLIEFNGKSYHSNSGGDFEFLIPAAELRAGIIVFSYEGLPKQVRNFNPAMRSTRYEVQLQKPSGSWGHGGAPVVRFSLPDDGKSNFVSVGGAALDDQTKQTLANIAAMMQASPFSRIALQACSGKDSKPGKRRALLIRNYLSEVMNIDAARILIPEPKRTSSAAERNRVYFKPWDSE